MEIDYQPAKAGNVTLMIGRVYLINDKLYLCVDCQSFGEYHYDLIELESGRGVYLSRLNLTTVDNTSHSNLSDEVNANFDIVDVTDDVKVVAK